MTVAWSWMDIGSEDTEAPSGSGTPFLIQTLGIFHTPRSQHSLGTDPSGEAQCRRQLQFVLLSRYPHCFRGVPFSSLHPAPTLPPGPRSPPDFPFTPELISSTSAFFPFPKATKGCAQQDNSRTLHTIGAQQLNEWPCECPSRPHLYSTLKLCAVQARVSCCLVLGALSWPHCLRLFSALTGELGSAGAPQHLFFLQMSFQQIHASDLQKPAPLDLFHCILTAVPRAATRVQKALHVATDTQSSPSLT